MCIQFLSQQASGEKFLTENFSLTTILEMYQILASVMQIINGRNFVVFTNLTSICESFLAKGSQFLYSKINTDVTLNECQRPLTSSIQILLE